jgi:tight adherence protein B
MGSSLIPSLIFAIVVGGAVWFLIDVLLKAAADYRENFKESATANLAAMFLFIEGDKLFVMNIISIIGVVLLLVIFTGSFVVALIGGGLLGASYPIILRYLRNNRITRAVEQLPDVLAAISSGMKSGQSMQQAIETVVTFEKGPVAQEFTLFLRELRVGVSFDEALDNFYTHLPRTEVQLVIAAMKIARETGSNLAETLERIAHTLRSKLQMEGKIRSLTAQGRLQGIVMASLPVVIGLVLFKMEPHSMHYMYTTWYGWLAIVGMILLDLVGYFFIRKIVSIDV